MSSNYRDVGEALETIFKAINKLDLKDASKTEMVELLTQVMTIARDEYAAYAEFMGWYGSVEEAASYLEDSEAYASAIEEQAKAAIEDIKRESPLKKMRLREWLANKMNIPRHFYCYVIGETPKAYLALNADFEALGTLEARWVPKGQVIEVYDVVTCEYTLPPHEGSDGRLYWNKLESN